MHLVPGDWLLRYQGENKSVVARIPLDSIQHVRGYLRRSVGPWFQIAGAIGHVQARSRLSHRRSGVYVLQDEVLILDSSEALASETRPRETEHTVPGQLSPAW